MKEIYKIYQLLVWTLIIILSSCSQEEFSNLMNNGDLSNNESNSSEEGKDSFIISYSLGEENASRVSGAPHKSTIQSLHYYVYNEDGVLVKKRQIRGISKELTWPLTNNRTDMSWELRQDLQDTLSDHSKYRILFIANADPKLFDMIEAEGKKEYQQPIINDNNYSTAQLVLPQEAFKEDNMYYMWEGIIDRTNPTTPGETLKRNDIVLRRVVTRIDFERKISLTATDAEDEDAVLYRAIDTGIYKEKINGKPGNTELHIDEDVINKQMDSFEKRVNKQIIEYLGTCPYKKEAKILNNFLHKYRYLITACFRNKLITDYVTQIKNNSSLKLALTEWYNPGAKSQSVRVDFTNQTLGNVMNFNRSVSFVPEKGNSRLYPIDTNGRFSFIGFGQKNLNEIESLHFFNDGNTSEVFTIQNTPFMNSLQEKNRKYMVYCNPIGSKITFQGEASKQDIYLNLNTFFATNETTQTEWNELCNTPLDPEDKKNLGFMKYIEKWIFHDGNSYAWGYGDNFENFKFSFKDKKQTLPNLTSTDAPITLYPSWMIQE